MALIKSRPIRVILVWQLVLTVVAAAVAAYLLGAHGAWSALLGGAVSLIANAAFGVIVSLGNTNRSATDALRLGIRAEASKILLIVVLMWLVLKTYADIVLAVFFPAFVLTVLVFQLAFFVREE
jgi:ATP synthase protein I